MAAAQLTHGHNRKGARSKEYSAWRNMINRCTNPNVEKFARYGARGIRVCESWLHSFAEFLDDVGAAPSEHHSIGRIDNDGHYEPKNVEWQTLDVQMRNASFNRLITHNGETKTIGDWATATGIKRRTISQRIDAYGWSIERALTTEVRNFG